ncbi:type II secretion system protein [Pleurocapsales cyanobacterium LEGE 06147]|nr:type II secretion system protein [Pleurocapsales cyanobacterium LEGE 06147]
MQLFNVLKKNAGFTLIEIVTTAIVVGVLAAIAVPSFVGLFNQNKVKEAVAQIEGALKEAQRQAMRRGRQCTVTINSGTITASPNSCLLSQRTIDSNININTNPDTSPLEIIFSHKGNVPEPIPSPNTIGYAIVLSSNDTNEKKCVLVAYGLGIIKSGDYNDNSTTNIDPAKCQLAD